MSVIALKISAFPTLTRSAFTLHTVTGMAVGVLKNRIEQGLFAVTYELFGNDHDEVADELRDIIRRQSELGELHFFELPSLSLEPSDPALGMHEIDAGAVLSILEMWDQMGERMEDDGVSAE